jgi:hypothetical protein
LIFDKEAKKKKKKKQRKGRVSSINGAYLTVHLHVEEWK